MLIAPARLIVLSLVAAAPALAEAQVLERPARPFGGLFAAEPTPDPNRTRHAVTFAMNLLGTQGDPISPNGNTPVTSIEATSGGFADASLSYLRAGGARTTLRTFEAEGRAYGTWYKGFARPLWGGEVRARAAADLGRRSGIDASVRLRLDPFVFLGGFTPLQMATDIADLPDTNPTSGISDSRSWSSNASASFRHRLSQRNTVRGDYGYDHLDLPSGEGFDSSNHRASLGFERSIGRASSIDARYSYISTETLLDASDSIPSEQHVVESSIRHSLRLSSTRTLSLILGGGATRASAVSLATRIRSEEVLPTGRAGVSLDLGRTWSAGVDYRRAPAVLYGVTPDPYLTDAVSIHTGGFVGRRLDVTFAGSYASGRIAVMQDSRARYTTTLGTGQLRFAIARACALVANYSYYEYQLRHVADLPSAFPPRLERSTVQAGLTIWIPLHRTRAARAVSRDGTNAAR